MNADDAAYLRAGIQAYIDGRHVTTPKNALCPHGRYGHEDCDECGADHFRKVLEGTWIPKGGDAL